MQRWYMLFCQLKFNICVRCDMSFIEPMHRNKPNITYLLTWYMICMHCVLYVPISLDMICEMIWPQWGIFEIYVRINEYANKYILISGKLPLSCACSASFRYSRSLLITMSQRHRLFGCVIPTCCPDICVDTTTWTAAIQEPTVYIDRHKCLRQEVTQAVGSMMYFWSTMFTQSWRLSSKWGVNCTIYLLFWYAIKKSFPCDWVMDFGFWMCCIVKGQIMH